MLFLLKGHFIFGILYSIFFITDFILRVSSSSFQARWYFYEKIHFNSKSNCSTRIFFKKNQVWYFHIFKHRHFQLQKMFGLNEKNISCNKIMVYKNADISSLAYVYVNYWFFLFRNIFLRKFKRHSFILTF